jgi:hypothetical protein
VATIALNDSALPGRRSDRLFDRSGGRDFNRVAS